MRSISNLFRSLANLAGSINALANLIDVAAGRLRQQLAIEDSGPAAIEQQNLGAEGETATANGRKKARAGS